MRILALLLILANVCVYFWAHYVDVPAASLSDKAAVAVADRAPPLLLARERDEQAGTAAAKINSELTCISVGPLADVEHVSNLGQRLQTAGFSSAARTETGDVFAGYWVSLQGFATYADAEQALKRLQASGITDAYILTEEQPPNVLSLGLFSEQVRAEQRRDAIAKLGFQPSIQNRTHKGETHWLDVTLQEPGQLLDPALLQPEAAGIVRLETKACPADATAVQAQSSAASAP